MPSIASQAAADSRKRATNLSLPDDALTQAKQLGLNVSAICSEALVAAVRAEQARRWHTDNRTAIEQYNQRIAQTGTFAEQIDAWEAAQSSTPPAAKPQQQGG